MTTQFTQATDIEEIILALLETLFTNELITNIPTTDVLRLNVLRVAPLQDDPTLTAPYLTYGQDQTKGMCIMPKEKQEEYGLIEIGGPIRYLYHYTATCGTGFQSTREACWAQIANLTTRVVTLLIQHYDLSKIAGGMVMSADTLKRIEGANKLLVESAVPTLQGGEQTWFGKSVISWHYPVAWYID